MFAKCRLLLTALAGAHLLLVPAATLRAQDTPEAANGQDPEIIGPPQLRKFQLPAQPSLPIPADTAPADTVPAEIPPAESPPPATPESNAATETPSAPDSVATEAAPPAADPADSGQSQTSAPALARDVSTATGAVERTAQTPSARRGRAAGSGPLAAAGQPAASAPAPSPMIEPRPSQPSWPYLLAFLLLGGIGGALAYRAFILRRVDAQVYAPAEDAVPTPLPPPAPAPVAPRQATPRPELIPAPPAAAAASDTVVAIRIRPWLQLEFKPERATSTLTETVVHYELVLRNSGNAVARNVRIQARMLNAGARQNQEITAFFAEPVDTKGSPRILAIPARGAVRHRAVVSMPSEHVREITVEGRRLFIPIVAFNVIYEWGEGKTGQTSMSYLVGRESEGSSTKMGAFRLDLGPRVYRSLGQRASELAVVV